MNGVMTDTIQYIHRHDVGIVFLNKEGKTYTEWYIGKGFKRISPNEYVGRLNLEYMRLRNSLYPNYQDRPIAVVRGVIRDE